MKIGTLQIVAENYSRTVSKILNSDSYIECVF